MASLNPLSTQLNDLPVTPTNISIVTARESLPEVSELIHASQTEGYRFLIRLQDEWSSGENRFDKQHECLRLVYSAKTLVGVGGINHDPYVATLGVGRLRHLYVLPEWRRQHIGSVLVEDLLQYASNHFSMLRLRVADKRGGSFYEANGFIPIVNDDATHSYYFKT